MRWQPEPPPAVRVSDETRLEWLIRSFNSISNWSLAIQSEIADLGGIITYSAQITDDAGDGSVQGDLNATDFTGHPYSTGTTLNILTNGIVTFGHKAVAYLWQGPTGVTVGVGGSHTAISADLVPIGTADHALLINRTLADSHPQSAITNLVADQTTQNNNISTNATNIANHIADTSNPHQVLHSQLSDVSPEPDPHTQYQLKYPSMVLGGTTNSFTLNTSDSKLVNYSLSGQWNWPDDDDIDPTNGEITVPQDGVYSLIVNVIGNQGNDNKEEEITIKLDTTGGGPTPSGRSDIAHITVATDKTSIRQLVSIATRKFYTGEVLSLYMWASAGLGTFTVLNSTFELKGIADFSEI